MPQAPAYRSRDLAAFLLVLILAIGGAVAWKLVPASDSDDAEEAREFHTEVLTESKTIAGMIAETQSGKNITEFRIGMFMMNLLSGLAEHDNALGTYFHRDGRLMQDYLTNQFQYHSEDEVAAVAALAKQGKPGTRESARYALESLRHIPRKDDPADQQETDRKALVEALTALNQNLGKAAGE